MLVKHNDLMNQGILLELLNKKIDEFFLDEQNKKIITLIMVRKFKNADGLKKKIINAEKLIINIKHNIMIENYKHAFHMIVFLERYLRNLNEQINS